MLLEGKGVNKYFGGLAAVDKLDFFIKNGEIVSLIGPNGAGKTTLFNVISGLYTPNEGIIKFEGKKISGLSPHKICKLGIGRTFQIAKPYGNLTLLENVLVGSIYGKEKHVTMKKAEENALGWLKFVGLYEKRNELSKNLNVSQRKLLEIARGLATEPKLFLIDEVMAGLNIVELNMMMDLLKRIRKDLGITIFWIEHVMAAVMKISDRIIVLHRGKKIAEGPPKKIGSDKKVIEAYLGEVHA